MRKVVAVFIPSFDHLAFFLDLYPDIPINIPSWALTIINQQSQQQMSKIPTEQRFLLPQVNECLPTFRQIGNYMNSISSASTIFLERDNTHTRLQSELKLNSNKPSIDFEIPLNNPGKGESGILSYSQTSSLMYIQDTLMHLKRVLQLLSSKENMMNHIRQSLALTGFNMESAKNIAVILSSSFSQYINLASKIDPKLILDELAANNAKITDLNKEMVALKEENLRLFEKAISLQNENAKARKKIAKLKQKIKTPAMNFMVFNSLQDQFTKIMNRMAIFQSQVFQKFIHFQDSLIKVTNIRSRLLKNRKAGMDNTQQSKASQKQNRKLQLSLEMRSSLQRSVMKELTQNNQTSKHEIQTFKRTIRQKNQEIAKLNHLIHNISEQLSEQKELYEQMLDKNIELQKEIFLKSSKPRSEQSQSFHIVDEDHLLSYMNEAPHESSEDNMIEAK